MVSDQVPAVEMSVGAWQRWKKLRSRRSPSRSHQRGQPARHRQEGGRQLHPERQRGAFGGPVHSMTSPRSRNLAMAVEPTKPVREMRRAASR